MARHFLVKKGIDRVRTPWPGNFRHRGALGFHQRPMRLVFRALVDPALDRGDLLLSQDVMHLWRRHHFERVFRAHPLDDLRSSAITRDDCLRPTLAHGEREFLDIKPQRINRGLARARVGAVAVVAILRQDRLHITIERKLLFRRVGRARDEREDQGDDSGKDLMAGHRHEVVVFKALDCDSGVFW